MFERRIEKEDRGGKAKRLLAGTIGIVTAAWVLTSPAPSAAQDVCSVQPGVPLLSDCKDANGNVTIGSGATNSGCTGQVLLDGNETVGAITINTGGALVLSAASAAKSNPTLTTTGIDIAFGGSLLLGGASCPVGSADPQTQVTITFTGTKPQTCGTPDNDPATKCAGYVKGIQVENGGTLRLYGQKGTGPNGVNWTFLTQPAGPSAYNSSSQNYIGNVLAPVTSAATELHLAADVTAGPGAWKKNDWIAVATTSFSPWEIEFVQIAADPQKEGAGSKLELAQPLNFYHFGGPDPGDPSTDANFHAGAGLNYGVDERAEVGLISRNIVLTSDSDTTGGGTHWGGEIRVLNGFKAVSVKGVELQKFGKEQLGSYPFHFHMAGDLSTYAASDKLFDSNSVDHSYNKCVTVHMTQNATFSNNVCARITGHIFYEEAGTESNISFTGNLGMGAMSNSFDVNATVTSTRADLIGQYYWPGDNMFTPMSFNQFGIYDTDDQTNSTRGQCGHVDNIGLVVLDGDPPVSGCPRTTGNEVYFEPPSGFWITNPSAKLMGNDIAGCQDDGKAYWYVPAPDAGNNAAKFIPVGADYPEPHGVFEKNRGHSCYQGLYDDQDVAHADSLFGYQNATHDAQHQQVVDEFDNVTMSRMRDRAIWLRPTFFFVNNARIGTSRDGATLLTSGGVDGNYPGAWGLLKHSTIVGVSTNNVDRWGPCGAKVLAGGLQVRGAQMGCIDQTVPVSGSATGGEYLDRGYATPDWPMFGFLIYDGPPLIVNDRFVNFRVAPGSVPSDQFEAANLLTGSDDTILKNWQFYGIPGQPAPYTTYEGDAAIGWFNANQSSYPAASTTKELTFTNVDLRHQVYTETVNRSVFTDGDKNTTIVDLDGTLSGFMAMDHDGNLGPTISLNNLEFNASSNSVDECLATGSEDHLLEGRPTAGMVPSPIGQLELEMLYPLNNNYLAYTQNLTFTKDTIDFAGLLPDFHGSMTLKGRNGLGDWEPKVTNGYGYTVTASPYTSPDGLITKAGFTANLDVSLTDTANAKISPGHPFYIQVGICYKTQGASPPQDKFTITKGYRSYGDGNVVVFGSIDGENVVNTALRQFYNPLAGLYPNTGQLCNNLDSQMTGSGSTTLPPGCPAPGVILKPATGTCPAGTIADTDTHGQAICAYPVSQLNEVSSIEEMTADGKLNGPPNLNNFFYDQQRGILFFWVAQTDPSAAGQSPLGNCSGVNDPSYCPDNSTGGTYYVCPPQGCSTYRVSLNDPSYTPGPSACPADAVYGPYTWPGEPANQNQLVLADSSSTQIAQVPKGGLNNQFPHYESDPAPACPIETRLGRGHNRHKRRGSGA
ncbi:MAG: G8 domain-containing protein [Acidobacteriaceae bacterium]|nr:G8 domain-containing protein [Acidobacteriaceae bacterium]